MRTAAQRYEDLRDLLRKRRLVEYEQNFLQVCRYV